MKKLTRNSLDLLARSLPVLDEEEQRSVLGGSGSGSSTGSYTGGVAPTGGYSDPTGAYDSPTGGYGAAPTTGYVTGAVTGGFSIDDIEGLLTRLYGEPQQVTGSYTTRYYQYITGEYGEDPIEAEWIPPVYDSPYWAVNDTIDYSDSSTSLGNGETSDVMKGAMMLSAGLLANDVTGIGVADDIAIPFILGGAWLYDNLSTNELQAWITLGVASIYNFVTTNESDSGFWDDKTYSTEEVWNEPNQNNNGGNLPDWGAAGKFIIGLLTGSVTFKYCSDNTKVKIPYRHDYNASDSTYVK